jgi:hypothetical protein
MWMAGKELANQGQPLALALRENGIARCREKTAPAGIECTPHVCDDFPENVIEKL